MWPERIAGAGVDHQQAIVAGAFARRADDRLVWASSALSASSPDPDVHCNRLLRRAIEPSQPSCSPLLPAV
jgi:hypothetical protein